MFKTSSTATSIGKRPRCFSVDNEYIWRYMVPGSRITFFWRRISWRYLRSLRLFFSCSKKNLSLPNLITFSPIPNWRKPCLNSFKVTGFTWCIQFITRKENHGLVYVYTLFRVCYEKKPKLTSLERSMHEGEPSWIKPQITIGN